MPAQQCPQPGQELVEVERLAEVVLAAGVEPVVLESYLGGRLVDQSQDSLTVVHVSLAMALMGLVVWLPLRAARST